MWEVYIIPNEPRDIDQAELDADFIDDTNQKKTDDVGTKRRRPRQTRQSVIGSDNDTPVDQPKRYNLREKKQAAAPMSFLAQDIT